MPPDKPRRLPPLTLRLYLLAVVTGGLYFVTVLSLRLSVWQVPVLAMAAAAWMTWSLVGDARLSRDEIRPEVIDVSGEPVAEARVSDSERYAVLMVACGFRRLGFLLRLSEGSCPVVRVYGSEDGSALAAIDGRGAVLFSLLEDGTVVVTSPPWLGVWGAFLHGGAEPDHPGAGVRAARSRSSDTLLGHWKLHGTRVQRLVTLAGRPVAHGDVATLVAIERRLLEVRASRRRLAEWSGIALGLASIAAAIVRAHGVVSPGAVEAGVLGGVLLPVVWTWWIGQRLARLLPFPRRRAARELLDRPPAPGARQRAQTALIAEAERALAGKQPEGKPYRSGRALDLVWSISGLLGWISRSRTPGRVAESFRAHLERFLPPSPPPGWSAPIWPAEGLRWQIFTDAGESLAVSLNSHEKRDAVTVAITPPRARPPVSDERAAEILKHFRSVGAFVEGLVGSGEQGDNQTTRHWWAFPKAPKVAARRGPPPPPAHRPRDLPEPRGEALPAYVLQARKHLPEPSPPDWSVPVAFDEDDASGWLLAADDGDFTLIVSIVRVKLRDRLCVTILRPDGEEVTEVEALRLLTHFREIEVFVPSLDLNGELARGSPGARMYLGERKSDQPELAPPAKTPRQTLN